MMVLAILAVLSFGGSFHHHKPHVPPAVLMTGQCSVTWKADGTTGIYRGDCAQAEQIAAEYPGAVVYRQGASS